MYQSSDIGNNKLIFDEAFCRKLRLMALDKCQCHLRAAFGDLEVLDLFFPHHVKLPNFTHWFRGNSSSSFSSYPNKKQAGLIFQSKQITLSATQKRF